MSTTSRPTHTLGAWLMIPDPIVVEIASRAGVDWVGLDLQHGAWDLDQAFRGIQLVDALGLPALVRVQQDELSLIPRVLDQGAAGVIVAMVESPEVIRDAIALARYAPEGRRSYGGQRYGLRAQHEPVDISEVRPSVFAMIEERHGLESVEEIGRVPGVAGLHVGPVDLGLALGLGMDRNDATFEAALDRIIVAGHAASIPVALHALRGADVAMMAARGFDESVLSADVELLRGVFDKEVTAARGSTGTRQPERDSAIA